MKQEQQKKFCCFLFLLIINRITANQYQNINLETSIKNKSVTFACLLMLNGIAKALITYCI